MAKSKALPPSAGPIQKPLVQHLIIIGAFLLVVLAYFRPIIFEGKTVDWHDLIQYQGMAQEGREYRAETGEEALWNTRLFGGMPAYQVGVKYPGNIIRHIHLVLVKLLPSPSSFVLAYFLGFYLLLNMLGLRPWVSGIGAAAFAFSSYLFVIIQAGHSSKAMAIAYMAPVIAGVILTYRGKYLVGGAITALFLALELCANHVQITYYLAIALGILGVVYFVDALQNKTLPNFIKASGIAILAAIMGAGPSLGLLWTTYEYGDETMRGKAELQAVKAENSSGLEKDYALQYSYGVLETFTLLIPDLYGGPTQVALDRNSETAKELRSKFGSSEQVQNIIRNFPAYWGDQPYTSGPVYVGALVVMLFILGLLIVKGPLRWWLLAISVLGIALAWGKNFLPLTDLFFYYFPLYNKFRAVSMMLVLPGFAMPLLGALALEKALGASDQVGRMQKKILMAGGIAAGLALLIGLGGYAFFSFSKVSEAGQMPDQLLDILENYRRSALLSDAFRSIAVIAVATSLLWLAVGKRMNTGWALAGLAFLVLIDMVPVDRRYLNDTHFVRKRQVQNEYQPSPADNFILKDEDPSYRVLNLSVSTFNDAITSYHHRSIGGYHAAKLRRYDDLISRQIKPEIQTLIGVLQEQPSDSVLDATLQNLSIHNMLNLRYVIFNPGARPLETPYGQGPAWFVEEVRTVSSPDEEIMAIGEVDLQKTAVVDTRIFDGRFAKNLEGFTPGPDSTASIRLVGFSPNEITYQSRTSREMLAVFSEVYYNDQKGWKVYIDGEQASHLRANYILRAMRIPAGEHEIEFRMEPRSYTLGNTLSMIFSIVLIIVFAGAMAYYWRKQSS